MSLDAIVSGSEEGRKHPECVSGPVSGAKGRGHRLNNEEKMQAEDHIHLSLCFLTAETMRLSTVPAVMTSH